MTIDPSETRMTGRPRKPGDREPNGRLSRSARRYRAAHNETAAERDARLVRECGELHSRFVALAAKMAKNGFDGIAISESMLTVATAEMLTTQGPRRTAHALALVAGALTRAAEADAGATRQ